MDSRLTGCTLSRLPNELLELICEQCDLGTFCALRLTCSNINTKTFRLFSKTHFSTVRTDLSKESLEKLQHISIREELNSQAQTLLITPTRGSYGKGLLWSRHENGYLEETQLSAQPLKDILCHRLTTCRSFSIYGNSDDGDELECLSPTDVTSLILSVIAQTGLRIRSFIVDLNHKHSSGAVYGSGSLCEKRLLPSAFFQHPGFREAWAHLEALHLHQDLDEQSMSWTKTLMRLATNLRSISLKVNPSEGEAGHEILNFGIMHRIGGLREISLRSFDANDSCLLAFLKNSCDTLETLSLWAIRIPRPGGTKSLFTHLGTNFPRLKTISILAMFETLGTADDPITSWIIYQNLPQKLQSSMPSRRQPELENRRKGVIGAHYTGEHAPKVLQCMAESAERWLPPHSTDS
ncbi:MAG: hypothetical protein L6R39_007317 [Caloplaca ligustica]|nr:MAG: hypothetical protein L6R39_007317 [Caloplaca ligustica]